MKRWLMACWSLLGRTEGRRGGAASKRGESECSHDCDTSSRSSKAIIRPGCRIYAKYVAPDSWACSFLPPPSASVSARVCLSVRPSLLEPMEISLFVTFLGLECSKLICTRQQSFLVSVDCCWGFVELAHLQLARWNLCLRHHSSWIHHLTAVLQFRQRTTDISVEASVDLLDVVVLCCDPAESASVDSRSGTFRHDFTHPCALFVDAEFVVDWFDRFKVERYSSLDCHSASEFVRKEGHADCLGHVGQVRMGDEVVVWEFAEFFLFAEGD